MLNSRAWRNRWFVTHSTGTSRQASANGPIFAAHLLTHRRGRGFGLVHTLLRPWSRVSVFSADRAGLLAVGDLQVALDALRAHVDPGVPWYPEMPAAATRVQALEDFDQSRVMTRLRLTYKNGENFIISPRIAQLYLQQELLRKQQEAEAKAKAKAGDGAPEPEAPSQPEPPPQTPEPEAPSEEMMDEVKRIEEALAKAWSLARCDARLTRRLGLL